jgi:hypothetical protein
MPKFPARSSQQDLKKIGERITKLREEIAFGTMTENQVRWVRILDGAYRKYGCLTERQLETLNGIYDAVRP